MAEMANIMEKYDLGSYEWHSVDMVHLLAESSRRSFSDRNEYLADPDFVDMRSAKSVITDPVAREAKVKEIAEYICDSAQSLHAYTIPSVFAYSSDLPAISATKSFELQIPTE